MNLNLTANITMPDHELRRQVVQKGGETSAETLYKGLRGEWSGTSRGTV